MFRGKIRKKRINYFPMSDNNFLSVSSSIVSLDHRPIAINSNDSIRRVFNSSSSSLNNTVTSVENRRSTTNVRQCSITEMLLLYAQKDTESPTNLHNILNVLELHFNTYANEKHQIFFEDIFRILNDFHEQITEFILIETMQFLQVLRTIFRLTFISLLSLTFLLHVLLKISYLSYAIYRRSNKIRTVFSASSMNLITTKIFT